MSSNESSGAPAEGTATTPAPASPAAPASFGSTRGSGLARGKRPSNSPAATKSAAPSEYKPTAIEIVTSPREYQNPFAPARSEPIAPTATEPVTPTAHEPTPAPAARPDPVERARPAPVQAQTRELFPLEDKPGREVMPAEDIAAPEADPVAKAELNILPPERPKSVEAQTWESAGFDAPRAPRNEFRGEPRSERPRRDERAESSEPLDPSSIPEKFLYVRPGVDFVPTDPNKWGPGRRDRAPERPEGSAPRERSAPRESLPYQAPETETPRKSGGFFGWIKSLFGGSSAEPASATTSNGDNRSHPGGSRRHRGGPGGENRGEYRGEGGSRGGGRRRRGGRGRSGGGYRGGDSGGPAAT